MGLDNIPHVYPCQRAGTAIMRPSRFDDDTETIDCDATIAAHQCPWQVAAAGQGTPIYSFMFGTPCWYRGKAGTWMLEELAEAGYLLPKELSAGFYGAGRGPSAAGVLPGAAPLAGRSRRGVRLTAPQRRRRRTGRGERVPLRHVVAAIRRRAGRRS